jgi:sec-independent protein translocase protein TatC
VAAPVMFALGAAFVYYVMLPFAIQFFTGYQVPTMNGAMGIELQAKVDEYLSLVMTLIVAFGVTFQLPVVLSILARVGIVNAQQLRDMRRYAIVALVALAAVFTPPDPYSMISLAVPLVALYEISIICVRFIQKGRRRPMPNGTRRGTSRLLRACCVHARSRLSCFDGLSMRINLFSSP